MSYTNPYNINQPLNPNMAPQLTTIDDNHEQVREIVRQENEKNKWEWIVYLTIFVFPSSMR